MTPQALADYNDLKRVYGLTKIEIAKLCGISRSAMQRYDPEPPWMRHLLAAWRNNPDMLQRARERMGLPT